MSGVAQLSRLPLRIATGEVRRGRGAVSTGVGVVVAASATTTVAASIAVDGDLSAVARLGAVLAVALVFLLDVVGSGFRVRREHSRILRSLGWSRVQAAGPILIEHLLIGLGAGVVASSATATVLPRVVPGAPPALGLWALTIAVGLSVAAALPIAWAASRHSASTNRATPAPRPLPEMVLGFVVAARRLTRTPWLSLQGFAVFALSAAAIVLLVSGQPAGGEATTAASSRLIAVGALLLLSGSSAILRAKRAYSERRDEARMLVLLGWPAGRVARTLLAEPTLVAVAGSAAGALLGFAVVASSVGAVTL